MRQAMSNVRSIGVEEPESVLFPVGSTMGNVGGAGVNGTYARASIFLL